MLEVLDEGEVGSGKMIASVKSVCGLFNDLVDYIAKEHPKYVENSWGAKDTKELREKLENRNHQILGLTVNGKFFGLIRDNRQYFKAFEN